MRTYAQLTTSFVVFCNRVGVDESISFWGGSEVIAPTGAADLQRAAVRRGAVHASTSRPADIRRERIALPLLRDERPELQVRELARIVAERAGLAPDSTGEPGAEAGLESRRARRADRARAMRDRARRRTADAAADR